MQTSAPSPIRTFPGILVAIFAALLVGGCAHEAPPVALRNTTVLNEPYEKVWKSAVDCLESLGVPVNANTLEGTIQTDEVRVNLEEFPFDGYAREPGVLHKWGSRRYNARYELRKLSESQTALVVICRFSAYSISEGSWHSWPSFGKYEESLISDLRTRLEGKSRTASTE